MNAAVLYTPPWVTEAFKYEGVKEIPGIKHNPIIVAFWKISKLGGIKDDETAWCAGSLNAWFEAVGIRSPRSDAAKSYLKWGTRILNPVYGCVVVINRVGGGGGHVGLVVGYNAAGQLLVYGGNQDNRVKVSAFHLERVAAYVIPPGFTLGQFSPVPVVSSTAAASGSEA